MSLGLSFSSLPRPNIMGMINEWPEQTLPDQTPITMLLIHRSLNTVFGGSTRLF